MEALSSHPNIGPKLEAQLHEVGIDTFEQLTEVGSKEAWRRILAIDSSACINRLCALEGAIEGIRWHDLGAGVKEDLKGYYHAMKG